MAKISSESLKLLEEMFGKVEQREPKYRAGVYLAADIAHSRMRLADVCVNHNLPEQARDNMTAARRLLGNGKEPFVWHSPDIIEVWRASVNDYNVLADSYRKKGIEVERIEVR